MAACTLPSKGEAASRQSHSKRNLATGLLARNLRRMAGKIKQKGGLDDLADFLLQALLPDPEGGQGALGEEAIALAAIADDLGERRQESKVGINGLEGLGVCLGEVAQE